MNPSEFQRWLEHMPQQIASTIGRALPRAGHLLRTQIMANTSGEPGPNVISGDYQGSWSVRPVGPLTVSVGTNRPQGPRLEYGFVGTDSLGRNYAQPPFPHLGPALQLRQPDIEEMIMEAIDQAMR